MAAPPLSPRKRKLRTTIAWISMLLALTVSALLLARLINRPRQYAPGESSDDVTSVLSRDLPAGAPQIQFTDVTREAGLAAFRNFAGARTSQLPEDMGPGLAWGDFDNDGDDDLFLVSAGGALNVAESELLPSELYENISKGKFQKFASFPELRIHGMGCAWGDYDADGYLDLVVSGFNALRLFRNESGRGFTRVTDFPNPAGFWAGVSWADYDRDGHLDLYLCGYVQYVENAGDRGKGSDQLGSFVPYTLNPASYLGGLNMLLRNGGDGKFMDVAPKLDVTNPSGRSLGGLWHDFDDDGWPDLYVANDISDNVLYHNERGVFKDISHPAWVADYRSAMGLAAGDYNRDGDDDLFITHWVAQENALYENHWADFHKNPSNTNVKAFPLRFTDVNEMRGVGQVSLPFVGWGTEFADLDSDGWLDLLVVNGNTLEHPGPAPKRLKEQEPLFFWNREGEHFYHIPIATGPLSEKHSSRGLALADYDQDGDLDLAIAQLGEGVQLLRNDIRQGNWIQIRLRSQDASGKSTGFADSARIVAQAGTAPVWRRTVSSVSYLSQSSRLLHIGLGKSNQIDRLEVRWPSGLTNVFQNLAANTFYEISEGATEPVRLRPLSPGSAPASQVAQTAASPAQSAEDKRVILEFWSTQRAAMNALKVEKDLAKAIALFRRALDLNANHEDSRYYLGQCLAQTGAMDEALAHLDTLQKINSHSHRAFQQWGNLRAISATTPDQLKQAQRALERAHAINPEETGALLLLGEVALLLGDTAQAQQILADACATNPRAANGFFLQGYIEWKRGQSAPAAQFLARARAALGKDWQPRGATSEGDALQKHHVDTSPLAQFLDTWSGSEDPAIAFASLDRRLRGSSAPSP